MKKLLLTSLLFIVTHYCFAQNGTQPMQVTDLMRVKQISGLTLSHDGKKVAFVVHGEVFAASAADGGDATRLSVTLTHTPLGRVLPGLVAEMATDPQLAASYRSLIIEPTRRLWREAVERGIDSGELLPDTDVEFVLDALAGPLYVRLLITGAPADPNAPRLAVQLVLARYGMAPAQGGPRHPFRTMDAPAMP